MYTLEISNLEQIPYEIDEAINRLHVNLAFCGTEYKKIMITSSVPDEGKSLISMHLWKKLASAGKKVVYVDADLRKSVIRSRYRMKSDSQDPVGPSHYLSGQAELEDVVYKTSFENAYMVPVVRNMQNPALLLHSERFNQILDTLADNFDYVIIDTPPLESVADGELISAQCDGVLLVVRSGSTRKALISSSIKQLERSKCKLLGVVLNRAEVGKGQYYYYKSKEYGYYKNYYKADEK